MEMRPISPTLQDKYPALKKALLFACITLLLASCASPKDFEYRDIRNIRVGSTGVGGTDLNLDLVYYNPNGYGVELKKVDCEVYVNNSYLGKFQLDTSMHIPRKAEFILPTHVRIDMQAVLKNGLGLLFNKEVLINVKGSVRLGRAGFYRTVPFNYEAKHTLNLFN